MKHRLHDEGIHSLTIQPEFKESPSKHCSMVCDSTDCKGKVCCPQDLPSVSICSSLIWLLGCPTFWRLLRKNSSSQILIGFSSLISKMTSFFNYDVILKCHLADFMQILTYLENTRARAMRLA